MVDDENIGLEALRAIQNEGTRAEVAQNFREQGNESAKAKLWKDGKEFYTKGIAVLHAKEDKWEKPTDVNAEQKITRQVEEACYINRALCNLELSMIALSRSLTIAQLLFLTLTNPFSYKKTTARQHSTARLP